MANAAREGSALFRYPVRFAELGVVVALAFAPIHGGAVQGPPEATRTRRMPDCRWSSWIIGCTVFNRSTLMDSLFLDVRLQDRLEKCGVVAVLVVDRVDAAVPLARALLDGGIDAMELTLRTPEAIPSLRAIREEVPEMLAGMGTVLNGQQVAEVRKAGAAFGVAPGTNANVIREAQRVGLPFAPGVVTPSDIETALELECRILKFFPAEPSGGLSYLKNMAAPYVHLGIRFIPLGGLKAENLAAYLADPLVLAVGGSWLAPRDLIQKADWSEVTRRAREARQIADRARSGEKQ